MWSHQHMHIVCFPPAQTFHCIKDEQKKTQHTPSWHARNDWDPLTSGTINHDSPPAVWEELTTNGQHTATYTNRLRFELGATVTHFIEGSTKIELHGQYKTPFLYLRTSEGDEIWLAVHPCSPNLSYNQSCD